MKQFLRNDNVHYIPSTIRFVKIILGGGISLLLLLVAYKVGGKVVDYIKAKDLMLVSLYEVNAMGNRTITLDTTAHKNLNRFLL